MIDVLPDSIFQTVFGLLESQAVGNIALLLAAIIGVGGNWWLYRHEQENKREKLRQSLHAEISSMEPVIQAMESQHDVVTMDPLDPRSFLIDSVYQASSDDLGFLTKEEVSAVVEFYSTASSIQRVIGNDFHVAYEQVARRDLLGKLLDAKLELEENGSFEEGWVDGLGENLAKEVEFEEDIPSSTSQEKDQQKYFE